jgi:mannose-6-phosphate isomerase-like protein (cupin superfamily)
MELCKSPKDVKPIVLGPESNHPYSKWWILISPKTVKSKRITLSYVEYPPGTSSKPNSHNNMEQIYYILKGEGIVQVGDKEYRVKPGMAIFIPLNTVHSNKNVGDEVFAMLEIEAYLEDLPEG